MKFEIKARDKHTNARAGKLTINGIETETPVFMPVGTLGTVKSVHNKDLEETINPPIILGNTYHLYLRPGMEVMEKVGGLHKFMGWNRLILTDSGGYQVFSLKTGTKINEEGVSFKSHIDGSTHFFSPEKAIEIQRTIGADIIMAFDECTPWPCTPEYAKSSMELTHRWLERCLTEFNNSKSLYGNEQLLFPIVQGSVYNDLRKKSAEFISDLTDHPGIAIGGLSVGEPNEKLYEISKLVCSIIPEKKPRYLMGVGTPANLLKCIANGVDMFDCVMPTRNARNGMLFTWNGIINIRNKKWQYDFTPINAEPISFIDHYYTKAYTRHLFMTNEMLGPQIATINNLTFYKELMKKANEEIKNGSFNNWMGKNIAVLEKRI